MENLNEFIPQLDEEIIETVNETDTPADEPVEPSVNEPIEEFIPTIDPESSKEEPAPINNNVAKVLYEELVSKNIAQPKEEGHEYSLDDVSSVLNYYEEELPQKVASSIVEQSPDYAKPLFEYVFAKGNNLTKEDLTEFYNTYLQDLSQSTEINSVDEARNFLTEQYKTQGFKDFQVQSLVDALEDESEQTLLDEAKALREKTASKHKEVLQQTKEEQAQMEAQQKEFTQNLVNEIKELPYSKDKTQSITQAIQSESMWETMTKAAQSPKGLIKLALLSTFWDEKQGDFNLEEYAKSLNTKETKSLKDKITREMLDNNNIKSVSTNSQGNGKNIFEHLKFI